MASSSTSICNSALIKIGADLITALSDNNKRAIYCNEQYAKLRDEVMISHPWNFAVARKALAKTVNTPIFDYAYEYTLPSDVLRVLDVEGDYEWEVAINAAGNAKVLLADSGTINCKYIKQVTDTTLFTPIFDECLATRLAADIAYGLVQNLSLQERMIAVYQQLLGQARSFDAQEMSIREVDADDWLNQRF